MLCLLSGCAYARFGGRLIMAEQDRTRTIAAEQLVFSVPLLLACLAGLYSERAGVFDTGLEGKMLAGTFAGASAAAVAGSARPGRRRSDRRVFRAGARFSPRSLIAATRSSSASPSVSPLPRSTIILGQAWFRQGARRRSPKTRASRRSFCPAPKRCAACWCSGRSIPS
ncbi:hypothetical protein X759_35260 [Mesorhizobium sp. LSHC420B00]|nr:hypothetical protein X759_35260 [Mesorhizobium sp. LSHC420B00]